MKFKCDAGVVVYLNGKIVYRRGLGKIFVNDEFSKTEYPTDEIKELWITHAALKIGENILGFEIHKHLNSLARDSFDILSVDFVSDEIDLCTVTNKYEPTMFIHSTRGYEYDRSNDTFTTEGHVVNNLNKLSDVTGLNWNDGYLVLNTYTTWYGMPQGNYGEPEPGKPLNITMRYPNNVAKTFTQYYLVVNYDNQWQFAPWIWTFHGSYDNTTETGGDWDILQTIPEAGFTQINQAKKTFQLFNQYQSYDYFRIMITRKRTLDYGTDQTFLHRLHVQYCKPRYCEADGEFPKSKAGFIASIPCPFGHIGSKDRNCKLNDGEVPFWEVAVDNNCKQVPTFLNYEDLTFYKGYNEVFIPTYDEGITPLNFETNCTFPNGISLNSNGQISGTSSADIDGGSFVLEMKCRITLVHQLQNYSEVVDFTYKIPTCAATGKYPETESGLSYIIDCSDNQLGSITRTCSVSKTPLWLDEVVVCRIKYPNTFVYIKSSYDIFTEFITLSPVIDPISFDGKYVFSTLLLPDDLSLNYETGVISGYIINNNTKEMKIEVNGERSLIFEQELTLYYPMCKSDEIFSEDNFGEVQVKDCSDEERIGIVTGNCTIDEEEHKTKWEIISGECRKRYTHKAEYENSKGVQGLNLKIIPTITNDNDDILKFTCIDLPDGFKIDEDSGVISGLSPFTIVKSIIISVKGERTSQVNLNLVIEENLNITESFCDIETEESNYGSLLFKKCSNDSVGVVRKSCMINGAWDENIDDSICMSDEYELKEFKAVLKMKSNRSIEENEILSIQSELSKIYDISAENIKAEIDVNSLTIIINLNNSQYKERESIVLKNAYFYSINDIQLHCIDNSFDISFEKITTQTTTNIESTTTDSPTTESTIESTTTSDSTIESTTTESTTTPGSTIESTTTDSPTTESTIESTTTESTTTSDSTIESKTTPGSTYPIIIPTIPNKETETLDNKDGSTTNSAAIIGGAVGGVVVLLIIAGILARVISKKKVNQRTARKKSLGNDDDKLKEEDSNGNEPKKAQRGKLGNKSGVFRKRGGKKTRGRGNNKKSISEVGSVSSIRDQVNNSNSIRSGISSKSSTRSSINTTASSRGVMNQSTRGRINGASSRISGTTSIRNTVNNTIHQEENIKSIRNEVNNTIYQEESIKSIRNEVNNTIHQEENIGNEVRNSILNKSIKNEISGSNSISNEVSNATPVNQNTEITHTKKKKRVIKPKTTS